MYLATSPLFNIHPLKPKSKAPFTVCAQSKLHNFPISPESEKLAAHLVMKRHSFVHLLIRKIVLVLVCPVLGASSSFAATADPANNVVGILVGKDPVNGSANRPLITITVCPAGSNKENKDCRTIDDVVVDTGSTGLKIFNYAIGDKGASLPNAVDEKGHPLASCYGYVSGYTWGTLKKVDIYLGGPGSEMVAKDQVIDLLDGSIVKALNTIDSDFVPPPKECAQGSMLTKDKRKRKTKDGNGILGIRSFNDASTPYFSCGTQNGMCTKTALPVHHGVNNPVYALPDGYNTGYSISIPSIDSQSRYPVRGKIAFGIGTTPNNTPPSDAIFATTNYRMMMQAKAKLSGSSITSSAVEARGVLLLDSGTPYKNYLDGLMAPTASQNGVAYYMTGDAFLDVSVMNAQNKYSAETRLPTKDYSPKRGDEYSVYTFPYFAKSQKPGDWLLGLPFFFGRTVYFKLPNPEDGKQAKGSIAFTDLR